MGRRFLWMSVAASIAASGCVGEGAPTPRAALDVTDVDVTDVDVTPTSDARAPDAGSLDATMVDVTPTSDARAPDAGSLDATMVDASSDRFEGSTDATAEALVPVLHPTADLRLSAGVHRLAGLVIPAGVTVTTDGDGTLELLVDGDVRIDGTLDLSGGSAGDGCRTSIGGGNTGSPGTEGRGPGAGGTGGSNMHPHWWGSPGAGVAAGGGGRAGVNLNPYREDGLTRYELSPGSSGRAAPAPEGGGPSEGGGADLGVYAGRRGVDPAPAPGCAEACYGRREYTPGSSCCTAVWSGGSGGGGSIGSEAARDLALTSTFRPGSGGGGGGGTVPCSGGGGGGGGGALRVVSTRSIVLGATARVLANGGAGGDGSFGNGGGGGSGGVIDLAAPTLTVRTGALVSAAGGRGGVGRAREPLGGDGGLGRIRIRVSAGGCSLLGDFQPPLHMGCAPTPVGVSGRVYVGPWTP